MSDLEEDLNSPYNTDQTFEFIEEEPTTVLIQPLAPVEEEAEEEEPTVINQPIINPVNQPTTMTGTVTQPKLGGLVNGKFPWIGGPPKHDFSGPFLRKPRTPLCYRGMDPETSMGSDIKGYVKRTQGCDRKFKRDDPEMNLMAFAPICLKHMIRTGMDTVFYMEGVDANGQGGVELFNYHTRYTKASVDKFIKDRIADGSFDDEQITAMEESAEWLENSLDESLLHSMRSQLASRPYGPQLWMMIVSEVQSDSLKRCDSLAEKFKAMDLTHFKGENVTDYAQSANDLLTQLERDRQLPRTHLLRIVDVFAAASVMDFKIHWMGRRAAVQNFIKESAGKQEATIKAMPNFIHFKDLLEEGKDLFMNLTDQWGPSKAAGSQSAMLTALQQLTAKVAKLDQNLKPKASGHANGKADGGNKELRCFNKGCGKIGYTRHNCPDCNKPGSNRRNNGSGSGNGNGDGKNMDKPKDGEPTEKMVDGVKYFYCPKCRRGKGGWNKTHKASEHKDGYLRDQKNKDSAGSNGSEGTPAATLAGLTPDDMANAHTWFTLLSETQE